MNSHSSDRSNQETYVVIISGNSLGLENDSLVLQSALKKAYPCLSSKVLLGKKSFLNKALSIASLFLERTRGKVLVFIHMEEIQAKLLWLATQNYLIPNQDWFRPHTEKTTLRNEKIVLLCKTRDALQAFSDIKNRTHYLGFSSLDRYQSHSQKSFSRYLHLAGKSEKKGTLSVINSWKRHPEWPKLTLQTTVVAHIESAKDVKNIDLITTNQTGDDLLSLMNSHGVHICVSEMEGFGHYIVEALSTGAVVVTTDGAPMNEIVTPNCGFLVSCVEANHQYRAKGFKINEPEFESIITSITRMPHHKLMTISKCSRNRYLEITSTFEGNVKAHFDQYILSNK
ncbi:glycosyltransferase [Vibrio sp. DNB22_19_1]